MMPPPSASAATAVDRSSGSGSPSSSEDASSSHDGNSVGNAGRRANSSSGAGRRPLDDTLQVPVDGELVEPGKRYLLVTWDLDTTGRRLIDEICHIGGFYRVPEDQLHKVKASDDKKEPEKEPEEPEKEPEKELNDSKHEDNEETAEEAAPATPVDPTCSTFSQYVMPFKNPNPGARRSFGIRVVNIGRYRMLKEVETGRILKTKSEMSALQSFIAWAGAACEDFERNGVLLACHEPTRKVLIPLLLEALHKHALMDAFKKVVVGFVNGVNVVKKFGDINNTVTSFSLRSLCKTVLDDTNPATASASDRCKVLWAIVDKLTDDVTSVTYTVDSEEKDLQYLKGMLGTQGTLRPIFEGELRQKRAVRERAMTLRKKVAESGLDYKALEDIYRLGEFMRDSLKDRVHEATDSDVHQLASLLEAHFNVTEKEPAAALPEDAEQSVTSSSAVVVENGKEPAQMRQSGSQGGRGRGNYHYHQQQYPSRRGHYQNHHRGSGYHYGHNPRGGGGGFRGGRGDFRGGFRSRGPRGGRGGNRGGPYYHPRGRGGKEHRGGGGHGGHQEAPKVNIAQAETSEC